MELMEEAQIEHDSAKALIAQIEAGRPPTRTTTRW